jgi:tripartite-type tricarboxylate transporter receptor subunit TctC
MNVRLLVGFVAMGASAVPATAQQFPTKPLRMLVGFSAGSGTDGAARMIGQRMSESLGQQVIVENRPGSGGMIATEVVAKSPPDGYTLLMMAAADSIQPAIRAKMPYDLPRDFTPISYVGTGIFLLTVHPSVPVRNVKELVALAKARPGTLNYASSGVGSSAHMAGELFNALANVKTVAVPYKGSPQAAAAVAGGEVDFAYPTYTSARPLLDARRLRALAVTTAKRSPFAPEVPTLHESGVTGYDRAAWYGVIAPAGLPKDILGRLEGAITRAVNIPELKNAFYDQGLIAETTTPDQFTALIRREVEQNVKLVRASGIKRE